MESIKVEWERFRDGLIDEDQLFRHVCSILEKEEIVVPLLSEFFDNREILKKIREALADH